MESETGRHLEKWSIMIQSEIHSWLRPSVVFVFNVLLQFVPCSESRAIIGQIKEKIEKRGLLSFKLTDLLCIALPQRLGPPKSSTPKRKKFLRSSFLFEILSPPNNVIAAWCQLLIVCGLSFWEPTRTLR
eukprot:TRINITY_DN1866_c0_g2_i1.p1 TRINITY_DN1866_c0_g2~~TRINITY_DN1866_c0_g2_i1.p1  ORF type:complete len:130 (+),score=17.84 TRINITY_DN1866_c0_g2_i1:75-464(+)